jgi:GTP pyrophosphokinase
VARKLLSRGEPGPQEATAPGSVIIRGSEGMAVQFAQCCRPIPGDPIIGVISKGQGMVIHTHDCPVVAKARHDPDRVLDVAWDPETTKLFEVNIKMVVANQRGVLAKVAAEIAEAGSNIQNVAVDPEDGSSYTNMFFTLQVSNRLHLARILRGLRHIPEVVRLSRVKG